MSTLVGAQKQVPIVKGPLQDDAGKRPAPIREVVDPQKPSGLVMTQIRSGGSHVMYHAVFKALTKDQQDKLTPAAPDELYEDTKYPRGDEKALLGLTTVVYKDSMIGGTDDGYMMTDMLRGFVGVCVSNTELKISGARMKKRRRREDPRMTLAVAGTVTMPFFKGSDADPTNDGSVVVPGDLVAFAMFFSPEYTKQASWAGDAKRKDIRVLSGTEDQDYPEFVPRIRKFVDADVHKHSGGNKFENSCTAPFGVCVGIDEGAEQITVLLRMDLYHSFFYADTQDDA